MSSDGEVVGNLPAADDTLASVRLLATLSEVNDMMDRFFQFKDDSTCIIQYGSLDKKSPGMHKVGMCMCMRICACMHVFCHHPPPTHPTARVWATGV
jgi:hypothetical protein